MEYLDADAAETFYMLSVISFECGAIDQNAFGERMACLVSMLAPDCPGIGDLREYLPDAPSEETEATSDVDGEIHIEHAARSRDVFATRAGERYCEEPRLYCYVRSVAGMKKWEFHLFDRDPTPSIPHGHHKEDHLKCDPYNGRVYYNRKKKEVSSERLTKKTRVALWQDTDFREFALKAIIWYEGEYPYFPFRVLHPHRLPRF
jgi:hypothetical protein